MTFKRPAKGSSILRLYLQTILVLGLFVGPVLYLLSRLWMADIFWNSGLSKIGSWSTTLLLFENEYKVPFLSPEIAAYLATIIELSCPILLVLGLASRLAVIPMLIMTAVIQFTYLSANENFYWAILLGLILCYGPGQLSLDFLFREWLGGKVKSKRVY